jgi:hypothetical protein
MTEPRKKTRAPFTDNGGITPATMAVDARPMPGEVVMNFHGPVALVQRGANNVAHVVMPTPTKEDDDERT